MSTISERILQIADEKERTHTEFAKKMNVTPAYISKMSKFSDSVPSNLFISTLCEKYKVNELWIRTGEGEKYKDKSRENEVKEIADTLFKDYDYSFRTRLVKMICRLSIDQVQELEKMARELLIENDDLIIDKNASKTLKQQIEQERND